MFSFCYNPNNKYASAGYIRLPRRVFSSEKNMPTDDSSANGWPAESSVGIFITAQRQVGVDG